MSRSRGSVFIIVVWAVAFLAMLAGAAATRVSADIRFASYVRERTLARIAARSAVKMAQDYLASNVGSTDLLRDEWSTGRAAAAKPDAPSRFKDAAIGEGRYSFVGSGGRYGFIDEERKLNLNTAPLSALQRLIRAVGELPPEEAGRIAKSIYDWRDPDTAALDGGPEVGYYGTGKTPYRPRNAPFGFLEELMLTTQVDPVLYSRLTPHLTVVGDGRVNVNTASEAVLFAIGFDPPLAKKIIRLRVGRDGVEATADDVEIADPAKLTDQLRFAQGVTMEEELAIASVISKNLLSSDSRHFELRVEATFGGHTERFVCVTDRRRQLVSWRE